MSKANPFTLKFSDVVPMCFSSSFLKAPRVILLSTYTDKPVKCGKNSHVNEKLTGKMWHLYLEAKKDIFSQLKLVLVS